MKVPQAKIPFLTYYRMVKSDLIGLRTMIFEKYGDINWSKVKGIVNYNVAHPDFVKHILQDNQANYFPKNPLFRQIFGPIFGKNSVFVTDNVSEWQRDRAILNMSFEPRVYFQDYTNNICATYHHIFNQWRNAYQPGHVFDIAHALDQLSLSILLNTIYIKINMDIDLLDKTIIDCLAVIKHKLFTLPFIWYISGARRKYVNTLNFTRRLAINAIKQRMDASEKWDDSVQYFMNAYQCFNAEQACERMADQLITQFAAAYFNLASLLHWSVVILSMYPEIERQISDEVNQKIHHQFPTYDEINSLSYLPLVIKEILRLYPPSFAIVRQAIGADEIKGFDIAAQAGVTISTYHVHRHQDFWTNPQAFNPERFHDNPVGQEHPFAYLPFGSGNRKCPGAAFSVLSASLFISMFVRQFKLYLPSHVSVKPLATTIINMRPNVTHMELTLK